MKFNNKIYFVSYLEGDIKSGYPQFPHSCILKSAHPLEYFKPMNRELGKCQEVTFYKELTYEEFTMIDPNDYKIIDMFDINFNITDRVKEELLSRVNVFEKMVDNLKDEEFISKAREDIDV